MGWGILDIFCEKRMHDPSQIPTQKHLTLPSTSSKIQTDGIFPKFKLTRKVM